MKKLFLIPLLFLLVSCPSKDDPHNHQIWIKCTENKNSSNLLPENFLIAFTITHSSNHQHQQKNQLRIKEEEVSKTILWKDNINYAVTPYFSNMEISLHINEKGSSNLITRNIQYHINRNTMQFSYTHTRADVDTSLISNSGGVKTSNAGNCRRISNTKEI